MTKTDVIRYYGTMEKVAKVLGLTRQAIGAWPEQLPLDRQCMFEDITGGTLKVDPGLLKAAQEASASVMVG